MGVVERLPSSYFERFEARTAQRDRFDALREQRRQYAYLLANLPGVVYRCEAAAPWKILFISEKVGDLTGYRREQFEGGLQWGPIVHPDDLPALEQLVSDAVEGAGEFATIYRIIHKSGQTKWVSEQGQSVLGDDGETYLEGFIQDITKQQELEQAVLESEKMASRRARALEEVLEATNDCVYSLDRWWRISFVNKRAEDYFGQGKALLGVPIAEVFTDPDSPFEDAFRAAMDQRERSTLRGFLPSRQSWYELTVAPTPGGITVFFRDTTEQEKLRDQERASFHRWKNTLNAIPQMVWTMEGGERQPDFYNDRWYEFTGLPKGSCSGPEWADLYHPDDREKTLAYWRDSRSSGASYEAEYRLRDREGNYRWVVSRGHAETDEQGAIIRWYGTCTDVHERLLDRLTLENSERHAKSILRSVPQVIWCADKDGNLDFVNGRWENPGEASPTAALGNGWVDMLHPDDRSAVSQQWIACVKNCDIFESAFRLRLASGEYIWTLARARPEVDGSGKVVRWFGTCTNIHAQITTQHALATSEQLNRGIVEASPDCMSVLDAEGTVLYVNTATTNAYRGRDNATLVGRTWGSAFKGPAASEALKALETAKRGEVGRLLIKGGPGGDRWYDVAVAPILDEQGVPTNILVSSRDFTERKLAEEKAHWAANHDFLTELPNRLLFHNRLEREFERDERGGFALLIFDVDYLKNINDGMGHDAGDALLREVANRLMSQLGPDDLLARLGGDEFGILLSSATDRQDVEEVVCRMRKRLAEPFMYAGKLIDCQGSIGGSIYPQHATERSALMKCADVALYAAKHSTKGHLCIYEPALRDRAQRQLSMLSLARNALGNERIVPFYQAKVGMAAGGILGFEALLRWRGPRGQIRYPQTIAAAFEDAELAGLISERMIDTVLDDVRAWLDKEIPFGHVALNAGSVELRRKDFADWLLGKLAAKGIPTDKIQLEVTETVFLGRGSEQVGTTLNALSRDGVKLALDDFGTGFASLSHLNKYPVDYIKIDRSFVQDIAPGRRGGAIVEAIIGLGKGLGLEIVAEGIENDAQHRFLCSLGCQLGQGFYYSEAVPAHAVPRLLTRSREIQGNDQMALS